MEFQSRNPHGIFVASLENRWLHKFILTLSNKIKANQVEFALILNLRWNLKIIFLLRGNSSLWNDKLYFFKSTFKNLFQNSVIFYLIWEFTFVLQIKRLLYCKKNQWSFFRSEYNLPQRSEKKKLSASNKRTQWEVWIKVLSFKIQHLVANELWSWKTYFVNSVSGF